VKNPERIIIVSDTVKGSALSVEEKAVMDKNGNLLGGCMVLPESVKRLTGLGFDRSLVEGAVSCNPERYLGL